MYLGRVGNPGAIEFVECVNPIPNFVIAYLTFGAMLFIVFPYIYLGRFHWVSAIFYFSISCGICIHAYKRFDFLTVQIYTSNRHLLYESFVHWYL